MLTALKVTTVVLLFAILSMAGKAQTQPTPKSTTVLAGGTKTNAPMEFKNEQGKVLTAKEAFALTKTGDYKMVKQTDKDNKPYLSIVYSPGYAPRPQSAPVKITPGSAAKP